MPLAASRSLSQADSCLANSAAGLLTGAENLNEAVRSSAHWSVKSIVRALQEELADIGVSVTDSPMFPQLVAKCNDLHGLLGELEAASAALDPDSQDLAPELKEIEAESQTRAAEPQIGLESGDKELPA